MDTDFEVAVSPEFVERIRADLARSVMDLGDPSAFTAYNRGGGPAGQYDRHYDKSTGRA
jgi:hypothetical protein